MPQLVKNRPAVQETWVPSLDREGPLEKGMATHSCILPGESQGQRSLAGYSPGGREELDRTEWLTHTVSVLLKEKAGGPSPQTQENRVKDHWQDHGLVHPGRVSDPFRRQASVFRELHPRAFQRALALWHRGLPTSLPVTTTLCALRGGKEYPRPPLEPTSEAQPASAAPPSLQAKFQASALLGGVVGLAEIVPNIWMRTVGRGQRCPSLQTRPSSAQMERSRGPPPCQDSRA